MTSGRADGEIASGGERGGRRERERAPLARRG
jgi:hypothetical protein